MGENIEPFTESDNWCKTIVGETVKSRFTWIIEGFKRRKENKGEQLFSNSFKICDPEGKISTWYLELYPRGDITTEGENHVSLFLHLDGEDTKLIIDYEMFILDVNSIKENVCTKKSREFAGRILSYYRRH